MIFQERIPDPKLYSDPKPEVLLPSKCTVSVFNSVVKTDAELEISIAPSSIVPVTTVPG
jgi:hypothetical protein